MNVIPSQADDAALLRAFTERGDRQAMNVLFARHADSAYRVALRCCRNAADAEDAVQTAFIEVLRHSAKYRGESAVRAWIFGFVVNATRHKAREEGRRAAREERASVSGEVAPDDRATRDAVRNAVQELPEHYRLPVWLHYCEGLSSPEVADALSLSENTVRSQLSRGVEELRSALATSGLAISSVALVGALATTATESAPATLTASLSGLASGVPATVKAGVLAKITAGTMAAAAILSTAAALWWGGIPEDPRPIEFSKIDEKVRAWQPSPEERRFDEIGWAKDLPQALRLAAEHNRPIMVVAHVGRMNVGRTDGGSMSFREGPLSASEVIEAINSQFVPVYCTSADRDNAEFNRITRDALKAKLTIGTERIYLLEPDGKVVDSLHTCHITIPGFLESLKKVSRGTGPTLVPPAPQSVPPAGNSRSLHLTSRYLDKNDQPLAFNPRSSYHAFPAEEWMELTPDLEAALIPDANAPLGTSWYVDMSVAARLLSHLYPLTGNYGPSDRNRIEEASLSAKIVAGRRTTAWIKLDGRVRLGHSFFPDKDERTADAAVTGYLEVDRKEKKIRVFRLVTEGGLYGKEKFGVALRSIP